MKKTGLILTTGIATPTLKAKQLQKSMLGISKLKK
jgi:hypothetical protein